MLVPLPCAGLRQVIHASLQRDQRLDLLFTGDRCSAAKGVKGLLRPGMLLKNR